MMGSLPVLYVFFFFFFVPGGAAICDGGGVHLLAYKMKIGYGGVFFFGPMTLTGCTPMFLPGHPPTRQSGRRGVLH